MSEATIGLVLDCADLRPWPPSGPKRSAWCASEPPATASCSPSTAGTSPKLLLQRVNEAKTSKNRMHLDIETSQVDAEVERLAAIGATRLEEGARSEHGSRWVVMADPEGNDLCVCDAGQGAA